jgi:hypothetical protein
MDPWRDRKVESERLSDEDEIAQEGVFQVRFSTNLVQGPETKLPRIAVLPSNTGICVVVRNIRELDSSCLHCYGCELLRQNPIFRIEPALHTSYNARVLLFSMGNMRKYTVIGAVHPLEIWEEEAAEKARKIEHQTCNH